MRVREIHIAGVTRHKDTRVSIPDTGVVLVTGGNGSGKSTIVESVPFAVWGKSLRGARLWTHGGKKGVAVVTLADGRQITRTQGGRVKLSVSDHPGFESTKHAQAHVTAVFGGYEEWRRSCVLSTQDAANFTSASDAERKRMLEAITGGDRLEAAYELARADRKDIRAVVTDLEGRAAVLKERVAGAQRRVEDLDPGDGPGEDAPDVDIDAVSDAIARVGGAIQEAKADAKDARAGRDAAMRSAAEAQAALRGIQEARERVARSTCPSCRQPIGDDHRAAVWAELDERREHVEHDASASSSRAAALKAEEVELLEQVAGLEQRRRDLEAQAARVRAYAARATAREQASAKVEQALKDLETAAAEHGRVVAELAEAKGREAVIEAAVETLSTRGVRAHMLGRTIAAVKAAANMWLGRIADTRYRLQLEPYGAKADGEVKSAVSLAVEVHREGAGDDTSVPQSYAEASGGERRRIDVAIMFALAQVAEAARGDRGSTIWCDEIFDALDEEGVARVADAVAHLARDRAVVVIAHNAKHILRTKAAVVLQVADGAVSVR